MAYHGALEDPTILQNIIRGLSLVNYHFDKAADSSTFRGAINQVRKHVTMLDGLALLITFKAKNGEVAATGMVEEINKVTIIWAKNAETKATISEDAYMNKLVRMFSAQEDIPVIMAHVVEHCKHKVCTRLRKIATAFKVQVHETENIFGIRQGFTGLHQLETNLRSKGYIMPTTGFIEAMDKFVRRASDAMPTTPVGDLLPVMIFAYGLMKEEEIMSQIVEAGILRRVRKVSDYYRTCGIMQHLIKKRAGHQITHLQIFPTPRAEQHISVSGYTVDALNTWTSVSPQPPIPNVDAIKASCGADAKELKTGRAGTVLTQCTQHCELTVALYLLQRRIEKRITSLTSYKIGCSKASCVWCHSYLTILNSYGPPGATVVYHAFHGKRTEGWLLPKPLPGYDKVNVHLLDEIGAEVEKIFTQVHGRLRLSDSPGLAGDAFSGDEDLEELVLGEGMGL